jgi:hypothetical protein
MFAAGLDSGDDYGFDVLKGELNVSSEQESADDLRALITFLATAASPGVIRRALLSVGTVSALDDHVSMVGRGLDELREWIRVGGTPALRAAAAGSPIR